MSSSSVSSSRLATPGELSRLRWRCRRGMLENDLIISRYLDKQESFLTLEQVDALYELMELSDNELWDVLSGRIQNTQFHLKSVVEALQAIHLSSS
jgi:antitoxin CptB